MDRFALLVLVGMILGGTGLGRMWLDMEAIDSALQHEGEVRKYEDLARSILPNLVKGTKFEGNWAVNKSPGMRGLSVYLFRSGTRVPKALQPYQRNCGYTGHRAVVICDVKILEYLASRWDVDTSIDMLTQGRVANPACSNSRGCKFILTWLLAHELGHILAGHGRSHFAAGLDSYVKDASLAEKRELDADAFVVEKIGPPTADDNDPYFELINALNSEIEWSLCPNDPRHCKAIAPGAGLYLPASYTAHPIIFSVGGSHPDFVVRTIRLLRIAEQRYQQRFFGPLIESVYQRAFVGQDMAARPDSSSDVVAGKQ